jgi:transcriptional regulator MraZ
LFLGEYSYTLDDKGRLTLPARFRDDLAQGVAVTRGLDGCLFVFTYEDWKQFTATLGERLPFTQKSAREFSRFFFSGAVDAIPDKQGRVLIPPYLREYAALDAEVTIIGANNRLELWNPERWQKMRLDVESNAEMIAEQFGNITF